MKLHDKINQILKQKGLKKKDFASLLLAKDPEVNRAGEKPSVSSVYAYLNGNSRITADYIPYFCEVLEITPNELFGYADVGDDKSIIGTVLYDLDNNRKYALSPVY